MLNQNFDKVFLILAIIIGAITFKSNSPTYIKLFPLFLLIRLSIEISAKYFIKRGQNNIPYYNFLSILEIVFYLYVFREIISIKYIRKVISILLFTIPIIIIMNILFFQGIYIFHTYTFTISAIILLILSSLYFYYTFKKTEIILLHKEPSFWLTTGIAFFFTSTISIMGISNYISILPKLIIAQMHSALLIVNCLFYILISIAFLCQINIQKSTHNS